MTFLTSDRVVAALSDEEHSVDPSGMDDLKRSENNLLSYPPPPVFDEYHAVTPLDPKETAPSAILQWSHSSSLSKRQQDEMKLWLRQPLLFRLQDQLRTLLAMRFPEAREYVISKFFVLRADKDAPNMIPHMDHRRPRHLACILFPSDSISTGVCPFRLSD